MNSTVIGYLLMLTKRESIMLCFVMGSNINIVRHFFSHGGTYKDHRRNKNNILRKVVRLAKMRQLQRKTTTYNEIFLEAHLAIEKI